MCNVKIGRLGKFDLNPRGELWRKDENRFGHKLLSKFGWRQGKGLGKNEDGIAENLKVRIKMGNTGVGWDEKLPIGIDYREYDAVLEDLSTKFKNPGEAKNEEISLEKRSQCFRNKRRIQKFIRGKDISHYSKKDMSCIFLSKEPEKELESTPKATNVTNIGSHPADHSAKESALTFNSQLSIADYFAMKIKNRTGSNSNTLIESEVCKESSQSEMDAKSKMNQELKSRKKAKQKKCELEPDTAGESSSNEENISESSCSSQEASEETLTSKEQLRNREEFESEILRKKKKLRKETKKLLNASELKQDVENNEQENNVAEKNSNGNKSLEKLHQNLNCISVEEFMSMTEMEGEGEHDRKGGKRKKEHNSCKKVKKRRLQAGISNSVEENSSLSESDDDKIISKECTVTNLKTDKRSYKESKKHKNKILNLKSCLKNCLSNDKYSLKEKRKVSFCENISFKIIENVHNNFNSDVLETNEQLLPCSDEDCIDSEVPNETEKIGLNDVHDSNSSIESSNSDTQCYDEDISCHENSDMVEDSTVPECFKLPKLSSTNYNSWLETQRIAARMKIYKSMVKKMRRHPILRKTNLLEIKGYGNWGL